METNIINNIRSLETMQRLYSLVNEGLTEGRGELESLISSNVGQKQNWKEFCSIFDSSILPSYSKLLQTCSKTLNHKFNTIDDVYQCVLGIVENYVISSIFDSFNIFFEANQDDFEIIYEKDATGFKVWFPYDMLTEEDDEINSLVKVMKQRGVQADIEIYPSWIYVNTIGNNYKVRKAKDFDVVFRKAQKEAGVI